VTVKALHHYDRLGLLKPRRTHAGYRLYTDADRERLEQIAAFKFIGLPLKQIKTMLDTRSSRAGDTRPPDRFDETRVSLYHDVAAAIRDGVDVTSERARSLIARWRAIVDDETRDVDDAAKTKINATSPCCPDWSPRPGNAWRTLSSGGWRLEVRGWGRTPPLTSDL
jgi:DNA-binding transcriptional MerR regulator